jgi:hypothetical protein
MTLDLLRMLLGVGDPALHIGHRPAGQGRGVQQPGQHPYRLPLPKHPITTTRGGVRAAQQITGPCRGCLRIRAAG